MPAAHRQGDNRSCGATTVVAGQSTVFVEGKLFSVNGDPNSHGSGALIASGSTVRINNLPIIVVGDNASPDSLAHTNPSAATGSGTVSAY